MLDLGGGEGTFTRNLLEALSSDGVIVSDLRMSDPVHWGAEYAANISGLSNVAVPVVENYHTVATAVRNDKFDFILASHSLYALLDGAATGTRNPIDELLDALRPGGVLLVVLASGRSHAYDFKTAALSRLFGVDPGDVVAEDLERGLRRAPAKGPNARRDIDNVIDLTNCVSHFEAGQPDALHAWLSYFLRVDVKGLEPLLQHELEFMLLQHTMRFPAVPECLRQAHSSGKAVVLTDSSVVLLHRTTALLWNS
jgi:SAM-dependent methyltransferase